MSKAIRLGEVATYINGFPFKPEDRGEKGLPIIRIQDLTGNSYDLGYYAGNYPKRIEINDGDVLISWSASLGVYVWNRGKALLNQHIFKVSFDKIPIDKQYFVFAVQHTLREMESKTHGATMKHIVKKDFDNTSIPYPSLDKQEEISKALSTAKGLVEKYQRELLELDTLIKARFIEMFGDIKEKEMIGVNAKLQGGYAFKSKDLTEAGVRLVQIGNVNKDNLTWDDIVYVPHSFLEKYSDYKLNEGDVVLAMTRPIIKS